MRLDQFSYVTFYDQVADTIQGLASCLGSIFVYVGVHSRFGTRIFTLPEQNGLYIEVLDPLDRPATDVSPFSKAVTKSAAGSDGWLTGFVSVDDASKVEARFGRQTVDGHRVNPDGRDISWKQIGVFATIEEKQLLFFIEWKSPGYPSTGGKAIAKIVNVEMVGDENGDHRLASYQPQDCVRKGG